MINEDDWIHATTDPLDFCAECQMHVTKCECPDSTLDTLSAKIARKHSILPTKMRLCSTTALTVAVTTRPASTAVQRLPHIAITPIAPPNALREQKASQLNDRRNANTVSDY